MSVILDRVLRYQVAGTKPWQVQFPDLDNAKEPPEALTALVRNGHYGLKTGRGVYDWSEKDGQALFEARTDRLFKHKTEDDAPGSP
jgi:3-hydroxyacyl-CoA dehydrogenase